MHYTTMQLEQMAEEQRAYIARTWPHTEARKRAEEQLRAIESELVKYRPYDVTTDAVILSGYECRFKDAEHFRTWGASVTVRHSEHGESSGIVTDSMIRYQIVNALQDADIPHLTYAPEDTLAARR